MNTYKDNEILYFYYEDNMQMRIVDLKGKEYSRKGKGNIFLNELCLKYGSDLEGRRNFVKKKLKIVQKVPVLISDRNQIIFFPFYSYRSEDNMWINYHMIKKIKNRENIECEIIFINDVKLIVNIHYRVIQRQMRRCKTIVKLLEEI